MCDENKESKLSDPDVCIVDDASGFAHLSDKPRMSEEVLKIFLGIAGLFGTTFRDEFILIKADRDRLNNEVVMDKQSLERMNEFIGPRYRMIDTKATEEGTNELPVSVSLPQAEVGTGSDARAASGHT